jgi:hypothetical protein
VLGYVDQIPNEHEGDSSDDPVESKLQELIEATFNLRKQAGATDVAYICKQLTVFLDREARIQKLYRPRNPNWMSWADSKITRLNAMEALANGATPGEHRDKALLRLEDPLIISFHTVMPPDRVSC